MSWFIFSLAVALVGGIVVFIVGALIRARKKGSWIRVITSTLLWVWAWGVLSLTFGTKSGGGSDLNLHPLDLANSADVSDFLLNVVMFLPAGILLAVRAVPFWVAILIGAGGSLCIELMQYTLATGRTADINDFVANTTGCLLGFAIGACAATIARRLRAKR